MRFGFILLALVAAASAGLTQQRNADQDVLKKQQDAIDLLDKITQALPNQELYNLGYNYDIISNVQHYDEPSIVLYYGGLVKSGRAQPQGTVFSDSLSQLRKEVALLTRTLLAAEDYSVFLKTAAWARVYVNEGQFVKAYISAILQHNDTQGVIPPPLYEISPHYYVDARVIQKAQNIQIQVGEGLGQTVVIPVNYTDYLPLGEHKLSYFTNDIGLNLYYAYVSLAGYMLPKHLQKSGVFQDHSTESEDGQHIGRGSCYYYLHQQLLAHYNLNRLSNGLGPIEDIDFEHIRAPYQPHLRYINGLEFPGRPDELHLTYTHHPDLIKNIRLLEDRLLDTIDIGYANALEQIIIDIYGPAGIKILGNLIEGNAQSVNYNYYRNIEMLAKEVLGDTPKFVSIQSYTPSALELFETAVRDPVFYQLYKRIMKLFHRYQQSLPAYQYDDLVLLGVKIEKIVFPDLVTYFDQHLINLENGVVQPVNVTEQNKLTIKGALHRLNHKQYEYQIQVQAEKPYTGAVVRVYLGPKFDYDGQPVDINHHRHYFVELDQFVQDLQEGKNVIVRNSQQSPILSADYPSVQEIKVNLESVVRSQNSFNITEIFGFPARLSLPKGTQSGFPLQVLVIISSSEVQPVAYGPVVPAEFQTYQYNQYQIVNSEQYREYTQQGDQQGVTNVHGVYQTVEVVPHYEEQDIYGNDRQHYQEGVQGGQEYQGGVQGGQEGNVETVVSVPQTIDQGQGVQGVGGIYSGIVQGGVDNQTVQDSHGIFHLQGGQSEHLDQYYQGKHISEIIGGAISLDNRPLGYPLERPLDPSAVYVPNMKVIDIYVFHEDV